MPDMQQVDSSNIHSIGYDEDTQTLHIRFKTGSKTYVYEDVPSTEYNSLLESDSIGSYFHTNIKNNYKVK